MTTFLWDQHNVGDAGFRGEQSYRVFYKFSDNAPWINQPIVAGARQALAIDEIISKYGPDVIIRVESVAGSNLRRITEQGFGDLDSQDRSRAYFEEVR